MIGKRLAHYEIHARLGSGGMGEVYRARDTRLDRDVALKVLPPDMAGDPERRQRFEREARAIAALNHPNIVTVYSVEESAGTHFLTMELVEGETLGQVLARGALSLDRLFAIAIPLADAVSTAHEKGITHRDLKPANIMLDASGRVKVLDFGLAKLRGEPFGDDERTLAAVPDTEEGKILGTLAYMSPEQAEGKPVDHRSDIFSLGVLLYEMATGRQPFQGETTASTLASILRDTPQPVIVLRDDLPRHLDRIIRRCLDKRPERRFQSAADLRVEIENLKSEVDSGELAASTTPPPTARASAEPAPSPDSSTGIWMRVRRARLARLLVIYLVVAGAVLLIADLLTVHIGLPDWFLPGAGLLLAIGLPILVTTAVVQARTRVRHWLSWRKAIVGGFLAFGLWGVIVSAYLVMRAQGIGPAASLVSAGVLEKQSRILIADFEDHTEDPLLGDAVKEAFSVDLSQSPVVSVVGSSGVARVLQRMGVDPDTELDETTAREVAVRDGIPVVVAGRINPAGTGYVFSVRLLDAQTGEVLTAIRETADSDDELVAAIDALSRTLRERIGESLKSTRSSTPLERVTTPSLPALQKYTLATRIADSWGDLDRAINLLEEAIEIDSTFAMAYRKLGVVLGNANMDPSRRRAALTKAFTYRDRLTERERYLTAAMYYEYVTFDSDQAIDAYEDLLEIDPDDTWALNNLGLIYNARDDYHRSLPLFERAVTVDSTALNLGNLAGAQIRTGRLDAAEQTIDRYEAVSGTDYTFLRMALSTVRGDYETAETQARARRQAYGADDIEGRRALSALAAVTATRGEIDESIRLRDELLRVFADGGKAADYVDASASLARLQATTGDNEGAIETMRQALDRYPIDEMKPEDAPEISLALSYAFAGDTTRARAHLERYREQISSGLRQRSLFVFGIEGCIAMAEGRYAAALDDFERWREEDPADTSLMLSLAHAFDGAGQPDSSRIYYERYLTSTFPFRAYLDQYWRAPALIRLGELYEDAGDREQAARWYGDFVELWKDADPELQPRVRTVQDRLDRLRVDR